MRATWATRLLLSVALSTSAACRDNAAKTETKAPSKTAWVDYRAADGSHAARFFTAPKVETRNDGEQASGMVLETKSASASDDARLFMVSKLELSKVKTYDCRAGLAGMVKSSLASMGCAASDERPFELAGRSAEDVTFACTKSPARGLMRVVCEPKELSKGRVDAYSVMALYQNELFDESEAKTFIDGFSIL